MLRRRVLGALERVAPLVRGPTKGSPKRLCTAAAEAAAKPAEAEGLLTKGQVDGGFWQGTALFGGVMLATQASSEEQRAAVLNTAIASYRNFGVSERITDRQLIEDFMRKNVAAAANVVMASPVFYFTFSKIMGEDVLVSSVRAITGTMRIVPFMGFFYGCFAVCSPFIVDYFMGRGQSYDEASGTSGIVMILGGAAVLEAVVELRGCGVLFSQMTLASFAIFIPALIGRLACGVLLQQQKTGTASSTSMLPDSWEYGPTWQAHTYALFERLNIDQDFAITAAGTTVFQYMLNAVTYVLLTKGRSATLGNMFGFMVGGMGGTLLSGMSQFGKTLFMRSCFGLAWNMASSQPVDMPAFDAALDRLPKA